MNALATRIAGMTTAQIRAAVFAIGGGQVDEDRRAVRYYLLTEFEARMGEDAIDALHDELGM